MSQISVNLWVDINTHPPPPIANKALQISYIINAVYSVMHVISKVSFKADFLQGFPLPTNGAVQKTVLRQTSQQDAKHNIFTVVTNWHARIWMWE